MRLSQSFPCAVSNVFFRVFFFFPGTPASHVRRVRVPSQASDVDQFLDDLFNPVLDQLSDARSLAASIKGSSPRSKSGDDRESPASREFAKTNKGGGGGRRTAGTGSPRQGVVDGRPDERQDERADHSRTGGVEPPLDLAMFARTVKGGGRGVASQQQVRCVYVRLRTCDARDGYGFSSRVTQSRYRCDVIMVGAVLGRRRRRYVVFPRFRVIRPWVVLVNRRPGKVRLDKE